MTEGNNEVGEEGKLTPVVTPNGKKVTGNGDNNGKATKVEAEGKKRQLRRRHESEESEVTVENMQDHIPTPPDGGWGWVIVFSSMICNLIVDGIGYSFGVFLLEFVDYFKAPKSKISLVGSLLCGVYLFAGPIVSAMTNKFGCRPVVIVGSCLAGGAFILATFSPSVDMLIITYGVIGGFGLGMVYLPSIVSVGFYFEKKRAFATGIAVCGSGIGTFMFPPLSEFLLQEYSWQGGLLIIAGIIFNACVCGALMRPLEAKPQKQVKKKSQREKSLLDRLKEKSHRNRTVSENSTAAHTVKERVLAAKLQREEDLQETDSDIGSLPSVAFVKRMDSIGTGDHRRFSGGVSIPLESHKQQGSISSYGDSVTTGSPIRDVAGSPTSVESGAPQIVVDTEEDGRDSRQKGSVSPDPASDAKDSEGTDYFTPPATPSTTYQNSPEKEAADVTVPNGTVPSQDETKTETPSKSGHSKQSNGLTTQTSRTSEFSPLLEVPTPHHHTTHAQRRKSGRSEGYGGSRTNMMNLSSVHSLHVSKKDLARPLYRKDIFYSGSVLNIPQFRSQPDMKSYITSITTIPGEMEFVDGPSPSSKLINKCCNCLPRSARDVLSEMVDLSLFMDISFMLICLGNISAFLGFYIPFMFLVDRAVVLGMDKASAAFLISIIGITNTVGRVVIGKVADLRILDSLVITYISIALCGVVTALVPFCLSYPLLATNAAVFGLGMAAFISLSSIIICDRMGLEKLTNAFGLLSMVRGMAGMVGPPLAGFMYDSSGSYDLSFYLGGLLLVFGAACHILLHLPCLRPPKPQEIGVDIIEEEILQQIAGSKPQIITVEEAHDLA